MELHSTEELPFANGDENTLLHPRADGGQEPLGPLLGCGQENAYTHNMLLYQYLVLRKCVDDYAAGGGCKFGGAIPSELDRASDYGSVALLRRFHNRVGHFVEGVDIRSSNDYSTLCLSPDMTADVGSWIDSVAEPLMVPLRSGRLWSLDGLGECYTDKGKTWYYRSAPLDATLSTALQLVALSFPAPLSMHTVHAWVECCDTRDSTYTCGVFAEPQETTAVAGVLGTIHNCQTVDMAQEPANAHIDKDRRYKDGDDYEGFVCSGHTAHSTEAGRVRKLCSGTEVRVLTHQMLTRIRRCVEAVSRRNIGRPSWLVYCMGKMLQCSSLFVTSLRDELDKKFGNSLKRPTLTANVSTCVAILSISSGVVVRHDNVGNCITSASRYTGNWMDGRCDVTYPRTDGEELLDFYYSTYFKLVPYVEYDRPPRTLLASVQCIQAVTTPYGAGTSSVAPVYVSKRLVTTPFAEQVLDDTNAGVFDTMPGSQLVVCIANLNDTYEDTVVVSDSALGRGLYSYMAYSSYNVNSREKVPNPGEMATMSKHRWWKTYSRSIGEPVRVTPPKPGSKHVLTEPSGDGLVIAKGVTATDQVYVRTLRYSKSVTGDKIGTLHGQKATMKLWREEDMPYGVDENGETIKFDMVISLSSIANRLTDGQYYEMMSGARAVRDGRCVVVRPMDVETEHRETVLYDGCTGYMMVRRDIDNTPGMDWDGNIPVMSSWGICNVLQMTQMTWDKQHYTHNTAPRGSVATPVGRTAGGGIRFGEMESHAAASSGLVECQSEIKSKMDLVDAYICRTCGMLMEMCLCGDERVPVPVSIPRSLVVFDHANVVAQGRVTKYDVEYMG